MHYVEYYIIGTTLTGSMLLLVVIVSLLLVSVLLLLLHQLLLLLLLDQRYGSRLRRWRLLRIEVWGRRYRRLHAIVATACHHQTSTGDVVVGRSGTAAAGLAGRRGGAYARRVGYPCSEKQTNDVIIIIF